MIVGAEKASRGWLEGPEVAELLEIPLEAVGRLAKAGKLTVRRLPGTRPRYSLASVEALAAAFTVEASL